MSTLTAPPPGITGTGPLERVAVCYVGDADLASSLLLVGAALGMDVRIAAPRAQWPPDAVIDRAEDLAADTGAQLLITSDAGHAVLGADYVIAGTWRSGVAPGATTSSPSPYAVTEDFVTSSGRPHVVVLVEGEDPITIPPQRIPRS
jgi:ornithine carbamoyltransferase